METQNISETRALINKSRIRRRLSGMTEDDYSPGGQQTIQSYNKDTLGGHPGIGSDWYKYFLD